MITLPSVARWQISVTDLLLANSLTTVLARKSESWIKGKEGIEGELLRARYAREFLYLRRTFTSITPISKTIHLKGNRKCLNMLR